MKILSKIKLPLIFSLIGFAHIFVSFAAFMISVELHRFILQAIFMLAVFLGATYLLYHIAKSNDGKKHIWLVTIGFLFSVVWTLLEFLIVGALGIEIPIGIVLPIVSLAPIATHTSLVLLIWILFWLPVTLIMTILEIVVANILLKRQRRKENQ